jgi:hypothetical protein
MKRNHSRLVSGLPWLLVAVALLTSVCAHAQEDESFAAELDGRKTWTIRFGFGSPLGLAGAGLSAGSFALDQTLTVDLSAEALGVLTVEGHFDDRESESLQSLAAYLDTDRLDGVFGDFTVESLSGFNAQRRKAIGGRLEYQLGWATLTGVAARFEGVTDSRTFVGASTQGEALFSAVEPDRPWVEQPYGRGIDGLYAYPLSDLYVPEISTVRLLVPGGSEVRAVLAPFGMAFLEEVFTSEPETEIDDGSFLVIGDADQTLLLEDAPGELVRRRVEDAIDAYNDLHDLSGSEDAQEYPFVEGSAYEKAFLGALAAKSRLEIDETSMAILEGERHRYYDLGKTGIVESSLEVEVSEDGERFAPITRSGMEAYEADVFPEEGILEVDFPASFFDSQVPMIRVRFSYTMAGGTYMLGFSLVPGSERITVNGAVLPKESYEIDYEIGLLVLLTEVEETDVIVVEYERYSGGLGGSSDYARYYVGLELDVPFSEFFDITATVQYGYDDPSSVTDPERVRTMPNRQTVAGVLGRVDVEDFSAEFAAGYGADVFPPGLEDRPEAQNEITAIAANQEYVFVGHLGGFSVLRAGVWRSYGTADGLSGRSVRAIALRPGTVYLGTSAGLTVVRLADASSLDRSASWSTYGELDGLGDESVRAVLIWDGRVWVGTDGGLYSVPLDELRDPAQWIRQPVAETGSITALASDGDILYVGTDAGVYRHDPANAGYVLLAGSATMHVRTLVAGDGLLYVGSDRGLRTYLDGAGAGWIVAGHEVLSVASFDNDLYYGTADGMTRASDGATFYQGWRITAIASDGAGSLWVGSRANLDYDLTLWSRGASEVRFDNLTMLIDGRDTTRFLTVDASANTESGLFVRGSFQHDTDHFDVQGDVRAIGPGYRAIGSSASGGVAEWSLDASADLWDGALLTASHEYTMDGGAADATTQTTNRLSFTGSFGPTVTATATYSARNDDPYRRGPENDSFTFDSRVSDALFADLLELSVSWSASASGDYVDGTMQRQNSLSAGSRLNLPLGIVLDLDWSRPLRSAGKAWAGSERWSLDGAWSGDLGPADVDLGAFADGKRSVSKDVFDWTIGADAAADLDPIDAGAWEFSPALDGSVEWEDGETALTGKAVVRSTRSGLTIRTTLSGDLSGLGEPVRRANSKLVVSASFAGSEIWRPSMTYTQDRAVTVQESVGSATSTNHSLVGHLSWTGRGASNALSVTVRLRDAGSSSARVTASLEDSFQTDVTDALVRLLARPQPEASTGNDAERLPASGFPTAFLGVDGSLDYHLNDGVADADAVVTTRLDLALSEMWGGSLSASYLAGTKSAGGLYHSFLFELTVAVDF